MPAAADAGSGLIHALFEFEAKPGRFAIAMREPRALFDGGHAILTLACGRTPAGVDLPAGLGAQAQRAARYFVRTAMLRQGADPYTTLGLPRAFDGAQLRDHYRMLMRLTHPDFASGDGRAWPADAATRINLAHDVLSSPLRRSEYDRTAVSKVVLGAQAASGPGAFHARRAETNRVSSARGLSSLMARAVRWRLDRTTNLLASLPRLSPIMFSSILAAAVGSALTAWLLADDEHVKLSPLQVASGKSALAPATLSRSSVATRPEAVAVPNEPMPKLQEPGESQNAGLAAHPAPPVYPREPDVRQSAAVLEQGTPQRPNAGRTAVAIASAETSAKPALVFPDSRLSVQADQGPSLRLAREAPAPSETAVVPPPVQTAAMPAPPQAAPVVAAAPPAIPVAAITAAPGAKVSMADVQPTLAFLIGAVQSGRGEEALQSLDGPARRGSSGFVKAYYRIKGPTRIIGLGQVRFHGRPTAEALVVDGVIQLFLQDESQQTLARDFHIRAHFVSRDGAPVMTHLSATDAGP